MQFQNTSSVFHTGLANRPYQTASASSSDAACESPFSSGAVTDRHRKRNLANFGGVTHRWRFAVTQTRVGCIDLCKFGGSLTRTLPSISDIFWGKCTQCFKNPWASRASSLIPAKSKPREPGLTKIPWLSQLHGTQANCARCVHKRRLANLFLYSEASETAGGSR